MHDTRSELGNLPPRIVGWPAKPITDARPIVGDGRGKMTKHVAPILGGATIAQHQAPTEANAYCEQ